MTPWSSIVILKIMLDFLTIATYRPQQFILSQKIYAHWEYLIPKYYNLPKTVDEDDLYSSVSLSHRFWGMNMQRSDIHTGRTPLVHGIWTCENHLTCVGIWWCFMVEYSQRMPVFCTAGSIVNGKGTTRAVNAFGGFLSFGDAFPAPCFGPWSLRRQARQLQLQARLPW